ncbi:uncharacterized protein LOC21405243 [Morus notabilis]|uniref:uncharacterized protein LOC21405243 n=1 Tax=Morus notabilis TaxID=981085 RepID=UPI000CED0EE4|nr:uncharacterized protein LOC21405243 [Morus notabilis]
MASMASPSSYCYNIFHNKAQNVSKVPRILLSHQPQQPKSLQSNHELPAVPDPVTRRELILRSSELAVVGAIFNFSGKKPDYLGVQKNQPALALCPASKNCISTSESVADLTHYAPPWNYNSGRKKPVSREVAMEELLQVIKSSKPDKFTPRIVETKDDYVRVEYQSPILGLVDDVEFWFPPSKDSTVEYRSASRLGNYDFDYNRKRIKALRQELEKKGWASQDTF